METYYVTEKKGNRKIVSEKKGHVVFQGTLKACCEWSKAHPLPEKVETARKKKKPAFVPLKTEPAVTLVGRPFGRKTTMGKTRRGKRGSGGSSSGGLAGSNPLCNGF